MDTATAIDKSPITPDLGAIKAKQQATWATGDYSVVGTTLQIVGEQLCETINLAPGSRVLDVAAGNGNVTLAAARRFCQVTSTDYVGALLDCASKRAEAERLKVTFQTADAEDLPFQDESFDAVLSTFGVMFTPDQAKAASELLRVCRKGGVIGMANWTPEGFIGQVFKTIGSHIQPASGVKPPSRWGTEQGLTELFGDQASLSITPRQFVFRYCSADHFLDVFRTYYGPINKAFEALGDQGGKLEDDLRRLLFDLNTARDGTLAVPSDYVDVTLHKR